MIDFQKPRKADIPRMMLGGAGVLLLALLAFFVLQGAWRMYGKMSHAAGAREAAAARLADLERDEARAKISVEELGTVRGLEAEVRERYGLARPGEGAIVVVRPEGDGVEERRSPGLWQKLWSAFFVW